MLKKHEIFVSSTYLDLIEERENVRRAILELDCIPVGMELFPAKDEDTSLLIMRLIDNCDCYVVIVGDRYGNIIPDSDRPGIKEVVNNNPDIKYSYTRWEYEYALSKGKPILAFIKTKGEKPESDKCKKTQDTKVENEKTECEKSCLKEPECKKELLGKFIGEIRKNDRITPKYWTDTPSLTVSLASSLGIFKEEHPSTSWQRYAQEFNKKFLSLKYMKESGQTLLNMVESDRFDPDIIFGVNSGGMIIAASMTKGITKPVGVIQIIRPRGRREIKYISVPYSTNPLQNIGNKSILVVDSKLKSAGSANLIKAELQSIYGSMMEIRFAVALLYVGKEGNLDERMKERQERIKEMPPWPIEEYSKEEECSKEKEKKCFKKKDSDTGLKVYGAYYTYTDPEKDDIQEEIRHG